MKNCIIIQTVNPNPIMIDFLTQLYDYTYEKKLDYTLYVVVDNNQKNTKIQKRLSISKLIQKKLQKKVLKIPYYVIITYLIKKSNRLHLIKHYIIFLNTIIYDNYWLLEDDVFIPSVKTIPMLDKKYKQADLLVSNNGIKEDYKPDWHWVLMVKNNKSRTRKTKVKKMENAKLEDFYFPLPWYHSWCPVLRISNNLLREINKFVKNITLY